MHIFKFRPTNYFDMDIYILKECGSNSSSFYGTMYDIGNASNSYKVTCPSISAKQKHKISK